MWIDDEIGHYQEVYKSKSAKRYIVIDHKTNEKYDYSWFEWNLAWWLQYILGAITGVIIFNLITKL